MKPPYGYITLTCLGWHDGENKMVFRLANRENKMYTWLVIPKKTGTSWIIFPFFSGFLGLKIGMFDAFGMFC